MIRWCIHEVVISTHPFSPFRIPFTTSLTPRFTCRDFDARKSQYVQGKTRSWYAPFFTVLCSFFKSFFCANGCAIGDKSSTGITISFSSFFDDFSFLGD